MGDADFLKGPVKGWVNADYIKKRRDSIEPETATSSEQIRQGNVTAYESLETTHFSIVDEAGNAVSMTYTLNGSYGSGVTATGLGFLLNNEMDAFAAEPVQPNLYGLI